MSELAQKGKDPFLILGFKDDEKPDANAIKSAHKKLIRKFHGDKGEADNEKTYLLILAKTALLFENVAQGRVFFQMVKDELMAPAAGYPGPRR